MLPSNFSHFCPQTGFWSLLVYTVHARSVPPCLDHWTADTLRGDKHFQLTIPLFLSLQRPLPPCPEGAEPVLPRQLHSYVYNPRDHDSGPHLQLCPMNRRAAYRAMERQGTGGDSPVEGEDNPHQYDYISDTDSVRYRGGHVPDYAYCTCGSARATDSSVAAEYSGSTHQSEGYHSDHDLARPHEVSKPRPRYPTDSTTPSYPLEDAPGYPVDPKLAYPHDGRPGYPMNTLQRFSSDRPPVSSSGPRYPAGRPQGHGPVPAVPPTKPMVGAAERPFNNNLHGLVLREGGNTPAERTFTDHAQHPAPCHSLSVGNKGQPGADTGLTTLPLARTHTGGVDGPYPTGRRDSTPSLAVDRQDFPVNPGHSTLPRAARANADTGHGHVPLHPTNSYEIPVPSQAADSQRHQGPFADVSRAGTGTLTFVNGGAEDWTRSDDGNYEQYEGDGPHNQPSAQQAGGRDNALARHPHFFADYFHGNTSSV